MSDEILNAPRSPEEIYVGRTKEMDMQKVDLDSIAGHGRMVMPVGEHLGVSRHRYY